MADVPVIAIDGPSSAGKGTIARQVAQKLGWHLLDSGALYRLTGLAAWRAGVPVDDGPRLATLIQSLEIRFADDLDGGEAAWLGDEDVGALIRAQKCGELASRVAAVPEVRRALVEAQRRFRRPPGLVADGRDMGTVIFPDAALKIFLTADPRERAHRRHKQLKEKGIDVSLAGLFAEISARDERDRGRTVAPLRPADDAVLLDTTNLSIAESVAAVLEKAGAYRS